MKETREKEEYILAMHDPSGETFALRYRGNQIVGVCGPLHYTETGGPLADHDYNAEDAEWGSRQSWRRLK